jgi:hypothetical protein
MNSCVAGPSVAVGRAGAISAIPVSSKLAERLYKPSELALLGRRHLLALKQPKIRD